MFDAIATSASRHRLHPAPPLAPAALEPPAPPRMFGAISGPRHPARASFTAAERAAALAAEHPLFSSQPSPPPWVPRVRAARPSAPGAPAPRPALFGPVVRRELTARLAARGGWTFGAGLVQAALIAALALVSARLAAATPPAPLVEVKLVRPAVRASRPGPPPPPAALAPRPAARPASAAAASRPTVRRPPSPLALVQPREIAPTAKPIDPSEPLEDWGDGEEGGVEGGVVGGIVGGLPEPVAASFGAAAPAPPPPAPSKPVRFDDTMTPPALVASPPLEYTQQALEREVEGTMVVECVVAVDGTVHGCRVLASLPFMDAAVVSNLEQRRYRPASLGGRPLAVTYTFRIKFKLPR